MKSALHPSRFIVVIPCYKCERYIAECLDSLLGQTFTEWTALVADDASPDGTAEVVRRYMEKDSRISLRVGEERAWLMGNTLGALRSLELHPADVVAILDGDDLIMPTCLERLWQKHCQGYDLVYTDETIQGQDQSIGAAFLASVPARQQAWRFSQLRSFKAYLFGLLNDDLFRDASGGYFRAAGDLALYLPMAELAGVEKVHFINEKLYYYRVHENCNFKVLRQEQLDNNWFIRSRPSLTRQTAHFDHSETVTELDKGGLHALGRKMRKKYPSPYTVAVKHLIAKGDEDTWRAYHNLWIENGVFLQGIVSES